MYFMETNLTTGLKPVDYQPNMPRETVLNQIDAISCVNIGLYQSENSTIAAEAILRVRRVVKKGGVIRGVYQMKTTSENE